MCGVGVCVYVCEQTCVYVHVCVPSSTCVRDDLLCMRVLKLCCIYGIRQSPLLCSVFI
jgi:hypothetical protein